MVIFSNSAISGKDNEVYRSLRKIIHQFQIKRHCKRLSKTPKNQYKTGETAQTTNVNFIDLKKFDYRLITLK